jgi:AMMECR1 domain-containing protein
MYSDVPTETWLLEFVSEASLVFFPHKWPPSAFQFVKLKVESEAHNLHGCIGTKFSHRKK